MSTKPPQTQSSTLSFAPAPTLLSDRLASHSVSVGSKRDCADAPGAYGALMASRARPGTVVAKLPWQDSPEGLNAAAASIAITLCNAHTPLWLPPSASAAAQWLRDRCGCPILHTHAVGEAQFAFCELDALPALTAFKAGTAAQPQAAATLVIMLPGELLPGDQRSAAAPILSGPGGGEHETLRDFSLPPAVWSERAALACKQGAGLDLILTRGEHAVCIPRTTQVSLECFQAPVSPGPGS